MQEGSPSLAGRPPSLDHVLGYARLRDLKPKLERFSDLIAEPEEPTFISYKVARSRLDRLRFVTQDPDRKSRFLAIFRLTKSAITPWYSASKCVLEKESQGSFAVFISRALTYSGSVW
jgi:hypothetical protein